MDLLSIELTSERLRLVPTSEVDAAEVLREFTAEITEYMGPKPAESLDEVLAFIRGARGQMAAGRQLQVMLFLQDSDEFIGNAGVHKLDSGRPELGIWIKKSRHGNGYGLEAVTRLALWAIEEHGAEELSYPVDSRNKASWRIPEALGGRIERRYAWTNQSGKELDLLEYVITASALREALAATKPLG